MDIIEMARELGRALQQDERYIRYRVAVQQSEEDEELQGLIGEYNLKRAAMSHLLNSDAEDKSGLARLDAEARELYGRIMALPAMISFSEQKSGLDALIGAVTAIITKSAAGEDPDTIDPSACTGDCSSCPGCH